MKVNPERYANQTKYIGDVDYHQKWVEKYNLVLKTLNGIKTRLGSKPPIINYTCF